MNCTRKFVRAASAHLGSLRPDGSIFLLAVAFGTLDFLVHPGIGFWWLAPIQMIPVLLALERKAPSSTTVVGVTLGGVFAWSLALHWVPDALQRFASTPLWAGAGILAGVVGVQAVPYGMSMLLAVRLIKLNAPPWAALAVSLASMEALVPTVLPYSHAACLVETRVGVGLLQFLGREGGTVLIVALNQAVLIVLRRPRKWRTVGLFAGALLLAIIANCLFPSSPYAAEKELKIGFLQSPFPSDAKRTDPEGVLRWHLDITEAARRTAAPDLVVWGETVLSRPVSEAEHRGSLGQRAFHDMLVGAVVVDSECPGCPSTNSLLAVGGCSAHCRYDKQKLVPVAEGPWIRILDHTDQSDGPFKVGRMADPIDLAGTRVGSLICFEGIFPNLVAHQAEAGAVLLVNVVSASWLGSEMASRALERLTLLGALEHGLPLVRVVDQGTSSAWDGRGIEKIRTVRGHSGYYEHSLTPADSRSFYSLHRKAMGLILLGVSLVVAFGKWVVRRREIA